jgi:hypothetical protein
MEKRKGGKDESRERIMGRNNKENCIWKETRNHRDENTLRTITSIF